jgi:hypothetical protein
MSIELVSLTYKVQNKTKSQNVVIPLLKPLFLFRLHSMVINVRLYILKSDMNGQIAQKARIVT